ncbi:DUF2783 domain-containing protein [Muricoccus aerilatus]|uniref:DUF2783 domain-containing protein n=1 Tax=Muricoccus aerilatus TaxID=452982 RepID=UPI0005C1ADF9|nr:DUF2783 domain-containing protein [Roseomonas aerilata]
MLNTESNMAAPDVFYEALLAAYQDLTPTQARTVDARLILLLSNHIGDAAVLREALERARQGIAPAGHDAVLAARA